MWGRVRAVLLHRQALHSGAFVPAFSQLGKRQYAQAGVAARRVLGIAPATVNRSEHGAASRVAMVSAVLEFFGAGVYPAAAADAAVFYTHAGTAASIRRWWCR